MKHRDVIFTGQPRKEEFVSTQSQVLFQVTVCSLPHKVNLFLFKHWAEQNLYYIIVYFYSNNWTILTKSPTIKQIHILKRLDCSKREKTFYSQACKSESKELIHIKLVLIMSFLSQTAVLCMSSRHMMSLMWHEFNKTPFFSRTDHPSPPGVFTSFQPKLLPNNDIRKSCELPRGCEKQTRTDLQTESECLSFWIEHRTNSNYL